jgi:hypothetical protein
MTNPNVIHVNHYDKAMFTAIETVNTNGDPVWGIEAKGCVVFNPRVSECGRFAVDPLTQYGISECQADALHALNRAFGYDDAC